MKLKFTCPHCEKEATFVFQGPEEKPKKKPRTGEPTERQAHPGLVTGSPPIDTLLDKLLLDVQTKWVQIYGDTTWIKNELARAIAWQSAKGKRYKNWERFLGTWLMRAHQERPSKHTKPALDLEA